MVSVNRIVVQGCQEAQEPECVSRCGEGLHGSVQTACFDDKLCMGLSSADF